MDRKELDRIIDEEFNKELKRSKKQIDESMFSSAVGAGLGGLLGRQSRTGVINGMRAGVAFDGIRNLINGDIDIKTLLKIWQGSGSMAKIYEKKYKQYVGLNWNDFFVMILGIGAMAKFGMNFNRYAGAVKNVIASISGKQTNNLYANQQQQLPMYQQQMPMYQNQNNGMLGNMGNMLGNMMGGGYNMPQQNGWF